MNRDELTVLELVCDIPLDKMNDLFDQVFKDGGDYPWLMMTGERENRRSRIFQIASDIKNHDRT